MLRQIVIDDAPTPIARRLSTVVLDEGYDLYDEWDLSCYDPDDFASWLAAYKTFPNRDQEGVIQSPTLLAFCGEGYRAECMRERAAGRCILTETQFEHANQIAETEEFRQEWEFLDLTLDGR